MLLLVRSYVSFTAVFFIRHLLPELRLPIAPKLCHLTGNVFDFYGRKQLLLSARLSHRNLVRLSVRLPVRHTGGSVKNGAR